MSKSGEKNNIVGSDDKNGADVEKETGITLDLDFAPSWARTSPEEHIKTVRGGHRFDDEGGSYDRRDGHRPGGRRDSWREGGGDRNPRRDKGRDERRGDRKPRRREDGPAGERKFSRDSFGGGPSAFSGDSGGSPGFEQRGEHRQGERGPRNFSRPEQPPLPLEIRVLPEQKALGGVIRRIQSSHRAFPLRDIAWLFLDKPASCLIRIAQQKEEAVPLFQCKVCGLPALTEEEMQNHLLNRHLEEFFDVEEVECEPPSGQFVCVMRCGISGELLGPPNHHSFNTKVQEMLRTRFPNMSEESYRRKIESVREAELIEKWRQSFTRKKIFRRKMPSAPDAAVAVETTEPPSDPGEAAPEAAPSVSDQNEVKAPPMERDVAELVFRREIMPRQYATMKHLVCIAATALQTPSRRLYFAIKDVIHKERRFPTSLFFALRGAFRHRKLYLFRAKEAKGPDFVMQKKPSELDPSHAVALVKDILAFINDNAACTKAELVHALAGTDEVQIKEILSQLAWLIEKGNVIEYYNDVLSAPTEYPAFRLLPGEKKPGKRGESVAVPVDADQGGTDEAAGDEATAETDEAVPAATEAASQPAEAAGTDVPEDPASDTCVKPQAPDVTETKEVAEAADAAEEPKTAETPEATETAEAPDAAEEPKTAETPEVTETAEKTQIDAEEQAAPESDKPTA